MNDKKKALQVVSKLMKEEAAYDFNAPVDWIALGLLDYPSVVARPMDLLTCKKNIEKNLYSTCAEFVADLMLIWSNCELYNQRGSQITLEAQEMRKRTQHFCNAYGIPMDASSLPKRGLGEEVKSILPLHTQEVPFEAKVRLCEQARLLSHEDLDRILHFIETDC